MAAISAVERSGVWLRRVVDRVTGLGEGFGFLIIIFLGEDIFFSDFLALE